MLNYDISKLPPSYIYSDIINKIGTNRIAYCYMGSNRKGSIIFRDKDNRLLMIMPHKKESQNNERVEMWAYIDEIPNGMIRQNAVNKWYEVYNLYYKYLNLSEYKFKLE